MTKSELIQRLAERNPHLFLRDIEKIVETVFEQITRALVRGDRVELRGFGAFSVKHRAARMGRNPRTGESVHVEAKRLPFFKTGKALREQLNGEASSSSDSYAPPPTQPQQPQSPFGTPPSEPKPTPRENPPGGGGFDTGHTQTPTSPQNPDDDDDNNNGGGGFGGGGSSYF